MITRDEALDIVKKYVKKKSLINHMLSVESGMKFYAQKLGEDVELWSMVGVLHDFDYEMFPNKEKAEVYKLAGKRLGCFCKPETCHGDVLAEFLNQWDDGE